MFSMRRGTAKFQRCLTIEEEWKGDGRVIVPLYIRLGVLKKVMRNMTF